MPDDGALLRQREKIDCGIICQSFTRDLQTKIGPNAAPIGCRRVRPRPVLRQQTPITPEEFRVCWLAVCRHRQFQLQCCAARDADSLTDQPACIGGKFYGRAVKLCRWRNFLHKQDFVFVSVSLNVARIDCLQWNRPLYLTNFPSRRQFPLQFSGEASVAGKFPVSMPGRSHSQQQPDSKRFAGNNCVRVGQQLSPNELFSLILLSEPLRR